MTKAYPVPIHSLCMVSNLRYACHLRSCPSKETFHRNVLLLNQKQDIAFTYSMSKLVRIDVLNIKGVSLKMLKTVPPHILFYYGF